MNVQRIFAAAAATLTFTLPVLADQSSIMVQEPYARSASPIANTGAAFMVIMNNSDTDDRLIDVHSDAAKRVELHTHIESEGGVMQMVHVEEGLPIAAHGQIMMMRGGNHVMFMGLNGAFVQDEMVTVTLVFEKAGEVTVEIPVDLTRKPRETDMMHMDHKAEDGS